MNIRKPLQDAIRAALADPTTGFNARLSALSADYDQQRAFTIDFDRRGYNYMEGMLDSPARIERSGLEAMPAMCVYSSQAAFTGVEKGCHFSGQITFHIDVWLYYRDREGGEQSIEGHDAELTANAVEGALLDVFHQPTLAWPTGYVYNRNWISQRDPVAQLSDGYMQRVATQLTFKVSL